MKRKYKRIGHLLPEVLTLKLQGKTHKEIGEICGLSKLQVKNLICDYNNNMQKKSNPKKSIETQRDMQISRLKLEQENHNLQMEVDLLRSFLRAAGRR